MRFLVVFVGCVIVICHPGSSSGQGFLPGLLPDLDCPGPGCPAGSIGPALRFPESAIGPSSKPLIGLDCPDPGCPAGSISPDLRLPESAINPGSKPLIDLDCPGPGCPGRTISPSLKF